MRQRSNRRHLESTAGRDAPTTVRVAFVYTAGVSTRYQQIVEQLHTAVGATTGYAYLESFVAELGRLFEADCAMVAVLDDENPTCLRTLALSIDGSIGAELIWPLPRSPGAALVAPPSAAIFKAGVQNVEQPRGISLRQESVRPGRAGFFS